MPDHFHETLRGIDLNFGGTLRSGPNDKGSDRRYFVLRGLREEAIASSQLEGASTTRAYAKRMLREKKAPRNRDDQMILNNHVTMVDIEERLARESLSLPELIGMQAKLIHGTLDDPSEIGRLRTDEDLVVVQDRQSGAIYHQPPPRAILDRELTRFIDYANDTIHGIGPTHPVIKAIILHFWIGYLHPFVDGNGRVARAVFYWYLLRRDYWAISYLSISSYIKKSPAQYRDAYLYSEQDDNDLTYFIDYNLRKLALASREFQLYQERVERHNRSIAALGRETAELNSRQLELLRFFGQNEDARTTTRIHADIHGVTWITASADLKALEKAGYLVQLREGRNRPFVATDKLRNLWNQFGAAVRKR